MAISLIVSSVILYLMFVSTSFAGSVLNGGTCNRTTDCDNYRNLVCYTYKGGSRCVHAGFCACREGYVYDGATETCIDGMGIGDMCSVAANCAVVSTSGSVTCTNNVCTCPSNTYRYSDYLCIKTAGSKSEGQTCIAQSECGLNLFCTYCPGETSGPRYCFSASGSNNAKMGAVLLTMMPVLSLMLFEDQV